MPRNYSPNVAGIEGLEINPLTEQAPMVGSNVERRVASYSATVAEWNALTGAATFAGGATLAGSTDRMTLTREYRGTSETHEVPALWFLLDPVAAGTALTAANALRATIGADTFFIGRGAGGLPLIQPNNFVATHDLTWHWNVESYNGGLVGRRLAVFEATQQQSNHFIILELRANARPDAPVGVTYDGVSEGNIPSPWILTRGNTLTGTGTLYRALATATYSRLTASWTVGPFTVVQAEGDSFHVEYSTDGQTTWSAMSPAEPPFHIRYRLADGSWSTHFIPAQTTVATWGYLGFVEHARNTANSRGSVRTFDWSNSRFLSIALEQERGDAGLWETPYRQILVPTHRLQAIPREIDNDQASEICAVFKNWNASGYHFGSLRDDLAGDPAGNVSTQYVQIAVEAAPIPSAPNYGTVGQGIRIRNVSYRSRAFRLHFWLV